MIDRLAMIAGMLMAAIVAITPVHASAAGCGAPPAALARLTATGAGTTVPDEAFFDDGDRARTLAEYRGRGIVLNFWATWCAPCVEEMPALDRLRKALADAGIEVLAVSEDFQGAPVVRKFHAEKAIRHLPILVDKRQKLARSVNLPGLPTTLLIDRAGREVARLVGAAAWDAPEAVAFLRRCLAPGR